MSHQIYKGSRGITHPKWDHQEYIMAIESMESSLRDVSGPNPQLVVAESHVNHRNHYNTLELIK